MQPDDPATLLILALAKQLGVTPVSITLYLPAIILIANRIARLIPDDAEGWRKYVRMALSVIGVKVKDRSTTQEKVIPTGPARASAVGADDEWMTGYRGDSEQREEETQGALALEDVREYQIPTMFKSGAARMNSTHKED